jgi:hypothetical protein
MRGQLLRGRYLPAENSTADCHGIAKKLNELPAPSIRTLYAYYSHTLLVLHPCFKTRPIAYLQICGCGCVLSILTFLTLHPPPGRRAPLALPRSVPRTPTTSAPPPAVHRNTTSSPSCGSSPPIAHCWQFSSHTSRNLGAGPRCLRHPTPPNPRGDAVLCSVVASNTALRCTCDINDDALHRALIASSASDDYR